MQTTFDVFDDDTGRPIGAMERTARTIIDDYREKHPDDNPIQAGLLQALLSLAQNIDRQNDKGREISRNMAQWLATLEKLADLYPEEPKADEDVEAVWNGLAD